MVRGERALLSAEQGFALGRGREQTDSLEVHTSPDGRAVLATTEYGSTAIFAIGAELQLEESMVLERAASLKYPLPATNLVHCRTVLPSLEATLPPGPCYLACAVYASETTAKVSLNQLHAELPELPQAAFEWFGRTD
jgi:hypothetical protein